MTINSRNFVPTSLVAGLAAGFLAMASNPARADSVTPERALLGRVDVPPAAPAVERSLAGAFPDQETPSIDGEGALLNRRIIGTPSGIVIVDPNGRAHAAVREARSPDGAGALLQHAI